MLRSQTIQRYFSELYYIFYPPCTDDEITQADFKTMYKFWENNYNARPIAVKYTELLQKKYEIDTTIEFSGNIQYYEGHGHALDDKTLFCVRFYVPIDYTETLKEIIDGILTDVNSLDFMDYLNDAENNLKLQNEINAFFTDEQIIHSIRDTIKDGTQDSDKFFDDPDIFDESDVLIGFIHVSLKGV